MDREPVNAIAVVVVVLKCGRVGGQVQIKLDASLIRAFERAHSHLVVRIVGGRLVLEAGDVADPQQHRIYSIGPEVALKDLVAQRGASVLNLKQKLMQTGLDHLERSLRAHQLQQFLELG